MQISKSVLLAGFSAMSCGAVMAQKRPNIIYIFTDQQNSQAMSCTGNPDLKTPAMDRLANEGIRFENAYCAAPLSSPSRTAMMTGVTPGKANMLVNGSPFSEPYASQNLGTLLKEAGYDCGYGGKWHLPESDVPDLKYGFEKLHDHNDYGLAEACGEFLSRKRDQPFFLVASFDNPHNICEYVRDQNIFYAQLEEPHISECPNLPMNHAIAPFDAQVIRAEQDLSYKLYPVKNFTPEDWRRYRNAYYRLTEAVDAEIGKLLGAIDKNKLWDNTIVIFSSDHGDGNGAHQWNQKSALYEETANIPFIVRLPQQKKRGILSPALVNNGIDLFATLCDYAGVTKPDHALGQSLRPVLTGKTENVNEYVVTETQFDESSTKGWSVRTARYKYIAYDRGKNREQLYDMDNDRGEMVNLAVEKKYKEILDHHRRLLVDWHDRNGIAKNKRAIPVL
ncbi:MAG: sulfatase family protein [Bacteroidales bacterium]